MNYRAVIRRAIDTDADAVALAAARISGDGAAILAAAIARAADGTLTAITDKDASPKLAHDGGHVHVLPGIAYLHPARVRALSVNSCPSAGVCAAHGLCYHYDPVGAAARYAGVGAARLQRTALAHYAPTVWAAMVDRDIARIVRAADRAGMVPAVRLNGLSDIDYRRRPDADGRTVFDRWPAVQFWDYTRAIRRITGDDGIRMPANYHLTFSLDAGNDADAIRALAVGASVAVLMGGDRPDTWAGVPVIDGDLHDYRFLDPDGVIVALRPKGPYRLTDAGLARAGYGPDAITAMRRWVRAGDDGGLNPDRVPTFAGASGPVAGRAGGRD